MLDIAEILPTLTRLVSWSSSSIATSPILLSYLSQQPTRPEDPVTRRALHHQDLPQKTLSYGVVFYAQVARRV